ncbi:MAG: hypothetical protein E7520_04270 [Ruminococcaceae bacterium]|nr:hypothetical protein [Oscillospiraceae bacterium]
MPGFHHTIKQYLGLIGRQTTVIKADGGEDSFFAVLEQTWKRNKTNFEDRATGGGRVYKEFCVIICPYDVDLKSYTKNDTFIIDGEKYEICRSERVIAMGETQFYRGILKKIREADDDVFNG